MRGGGGYGSWGPWIICLFFIIISFSPFPCLVVIYSRFYSVLYVKGGMMRGFVSVRGVTGGRV